MDDDPIRLGWDQHHFELSMEPHLRPATPFILPAHALHLNFWRTQNGSGDELTQKHAQRIRATCSELEKVSVSGFRPPPSPSDELANDPHDHYENNATQELELDFEGVVLIARVEEHVEYLPRTVMTPWSGRSTPRGARQTNAEFWRPVFAPQAGDNLFARICNSRRQIGLNFLNAKLAIDIAAEKLAQSKSSDTAEAQTESRPPADSYARPILAALEAIAALEYFVPGWSKNSAFLDAPKGPNGRPALDIDAAEGLMREIAACDAGKDANAAIDGGSWRNIVSCGLLASNVLYTESLGIRAAARRKAGVRSIISFYPRGLFLRSQAALPHCIPKRSTRRCPIWSRD